MAAPAQSSEISILSQSKKNVVYSWFLFFNAPYSLIILNYPASMIRWFGWVLTLQNPQIWYGWFRSFRPSLSIFSQDTQRRQFFLWGRSNPVYRSTWVANQRFQVSSPQALLGALTLRLHSLDWLSNTRTTRWKRSEYLLVCCMWLQWVHFPI